MRSLTAPMLIAAMAGSALLSGCAGGSQSNNSMVPGSDAVPLPRALPNGRVNPNDYEGLRDLYVGDLDGQAVKILKNKTYREIGAITNGIQNPNGMVLDRRGNLYVANDSVPSITEYAPNATSPSFTYSLGMQSAISVSVDVHGNVYEADGTGYTEQYSQGINAPVAGCTPSGATGVTGVAVDAANDVFVSVITGGVNFIAEYPGGFGDCSHEKVLTAPVVFPYGISIDKNKDLLVADADNARVDVIDPPYSSVTRTIGAGFLEPTTVTLSRNNKLAFATDFQVHDVFVINYQTGAMITTLGSIYGLADPTAAVDGPNAVY
ncbi:MAG: hypothetical protein WB681_06040 [Candidatus Cybelea sp.]